MIDFEEYDTRRHLQIEPSQVHSICKPGTYASGAFVLLEDGRWIKVRQGPKECWMLVRRARREQQRNSS